MPARESEIDSVRRATDDFGNAPAPLPDLAACDPSVGDEGELSLLRDSLAKTPGSGCKPTAGGMSIHGGMFKRFA